MKKFNFWNLPLWFFDIISFVKNQVLIYLLLSFVMWEANIVEWNSAVRLIFVFLGIANAYVCFKND